MERAGLLEHERAGLREGEPLAAALPLLAFALLHNTRIEADTGIVEENASIYFADIDADDFAGEQGLHRLLELKRDTQILGEMVESSHRQHAENGILVDQRC